MAYVNGQKAGVYGRRGHAGHDQEVGDRERVVLETSRIQAGSILARGRIPWHPKGDTVSAIETIYALIAKKTGRKLGGAFADLSWR